MLGFSRHHLFPHQFSRGTVQGNHVGVVGGHKRLVAKDGHAAIRPQGRITNHGCRTLARVCPNLTPGLSVQRVDRTRTGDVHDAVGNQRSHLQPEVGKVLNEV